MNPSSTLITLETAREILGNDYDCHADEKLEELIVFLTMVINKVVDSHLLNNS